MITHKELQARIIQVGLEVGMSHKEAVEYANEYILAKGEEAYYHYETVGDNYDNR